MKKLLAFALTLMLVMGTALAFAGPVHINGPGITPVFTIDAVSATEPGLVAIEPVGTDGYFVFPVIAVYCLKIEESDTVSFLSAGSYRGFYNIVVPSVRTLPFIVAAVSSATPEINRFYGVVCQTQEVMPLVGSSRPTLGTMS